MKTFYFCSCINVILFLVKTANKKAEKNKKSTLKAPNSISEEGQYNSIKEGE